MNDTVVQMPTVVPEEPEEPKEEQDVLKKIPKFEPTKTFQLSCPVQAAFGKTGSATPPITEVTLRAPNTLDVFEVGGSVSRPFWTPQGMSVEMDTVRMKAWLRRLSGLDLPIIYQIPARDMKHMYDWLNGELSALGN